MGVISPISSTNTGSSSSSTAAEATSSLDKDDFLQLLVTKLTNQDPLNPMEDEAFIAELAQFSSLEQMQNMNTSLENSLQWDYLQMQTINNTMATSLIGKGIKASFDGVYLNSNNSPQIQFTTDRAASSIKIEIKNSSGTVVRTLTEKDIPAGENSIKWDGKDNNGERLDTGYYSISITGYDLSGDSFTPSTFVEGNVNGVVYHDGAAYLQVDGMEIPLGNVSEILAAEE
jgi:flagellar basal-body rod modification protein FlgD